MYRSYSAYLLALGLALILGTGVQATPLPPDQVSWQYNFSPGAAAVVSDNSPVGSVTFTNEPTRSATGTSDVVATNLRVASTLPANMPNLLSTNGAYSLTLAMTMAENGVVHTESFTFHGKLSGSFSSESANLKNLFAAGSHVFHLGSYDFTVSMDAYTPPGPPNQVQTGSISAHVEVTLRDTGVITETPEPASIVLGGLALTFFGGAALRRRRKVQAGL